MSSPRQDARNPEKPSPFWKGGGFFFKLLPLHLHTRAIDGVLRKSHISFSHHILS